MERSPDRAQRHTARSVLRRIDDDTLDHLMEVETKPETTSRRLEALDREWDVDRTIEAEAATMGLIGLALGTFVRPAFLALPATVGASRRCTLRTGADTYGVTVTVTSVQGTDVKFDIQVDKTPTTEPSR